MAILAATEPHYYPLRKRSEKNMHPYTKLVWTDPNALRAPNGKRPDLSILEEPRSSSGNPRNTSLVDPDNSEDEEYVPGLPEETANDTQLIDPAVEGLDEAEGGSTLPLLEHRQGFTYRHMAARRRQQQRRPPRKRPRGDKQTVDSAGPSTQHRKSDNRHSNHFPSVSAVLGLCHSDAGDSSDASADDASDPFGVPAFGDIHTKSMTASTSARDMRASSGGDLAHTVTESPILERHGRVVGVSEPSSDGDDAAAESSTNSVSGLKRQRRMLSRRRYNRVDTENQAQSGLESEAEAEALPTSRARKLSKLSRNQIRGILPFSFMRDLSRDKSQAIQEEVDRWKYSGSRGTPKRRILPSSPSGDDSPIEQEPFDLGQDDTRAANDVSEMFSDLAIPSPRLDREPLATRCPLFAFNFIDIYEWQYPPLAPEGSVDRAPDFLRVAAREARRQGIRAKSVPDDPAKKSIYICPRSVAEFEDEDVAQSILLSWNLGMIDLRRVYFSAEYGSSDSELDEYPVLADSFGEDWPVHTDMPFADAPGLQPELIVLSDDGSEAAEDNTVSIMSLGRSRSGSGHKSRPRQAAASRAKGQRNLFGGKSTGLMRSRKPNKRPSVYLHRQNARALPTAHKLTSVMNEFAALDSDSNCESDDDARRRGTVNQHLLALDKSRINEARQQRFASQFQRLPTSTKGHSSRHHSHGNPSRSSRGQTRRLSLHSTDQQPQSPARAEFLFDDDQARAVGQRQSVAAKKQQTTLLPSKLAPHQMSAAVATANRPAGSKLDSVVSRIGMLQPKLVSNSRRMPAQRRSYQSRKSAPVRNAQPVSVPTRVQLHNDAYSRIRSNATSGWAERRIHDADDLPDDSALNPNLTNMVAESQGTLFSLTSGARFDNDIWISQGGICLVQQLLFRAYRLGV
ncbi:hypothetical protein GGI21_002399, partial [Coemansia aciculifera]